MSDLQQTNLLVKRMFDVTMAILAVVLLCPLLLLIVLLIRFTMGIPILFCQTRPGLNGHSFMFYKFRTMTNECDEKGDLLPDEERLTSMGSYLCKISLDELPGLINVLKGDMSLVGPRPLLVQYLERYSPEQARRHEIKPLL